MNKLKIRLWDKVEKKMYFDGADLTSTFGLVCSMNKNFEIEFHKDFEIQRFTGLKDKNDREIYEGDIVIVYEKRVGTIQFQQGRFEVFDKNNYSIGYKEEFLIASCKIIGNIFENPDLLK